jgi:mevalonate kinase
MITIHPAPGNLHLFGEHIVVYSTKAIASAMNLHTNATVA